MLTYLQLINCKKREILYEVYLGYNDLGLCNTSAIALYIV